MKYRLDYLPIAIKDLTDIATYIADKLKAPKAAIDLLGALYKAITGLQDSPYSH